MQHPALRAAISQNTSHGVLQYNFNHPGTILPQGCRCDGIVQSKRQVLLDKHYQSG